MLMILIIIGAITQPDVIRPLYLPDSFGGGRNVSPLVDMLDMSCGGYPHDIRTMPG